jgi:hypothetical protein
MTEALQKTTLCRSNVTLQVDNRNNAVINLSSPGPNGSKIHKEKLNLEVSTRLGFSHFMEMQTPKNADPIIPERCYNTNEMRLKISEEINYIYPKNDVIIKCIDSSGIIAQKSVTLTWNDNIVIFSNRNEKKNIVISLKNGIIVAAKFETEKLPPKIEICLEEDYLEVDKDAVLCKQYNCSPSEIHRVYTKQGIILRYVDSDIIEAWHPDGSVYRMKKNEKDWHCISGPPNVHNGQKLSKETIFPDRNVRYFREDSIEVTFFSDDATQAKFHDNTAIYKQTQKYVRYSNELKTFQIEYLQGVTKIIVNDTTLLLEGFQLTIENVIFLNAAINKCRH